MGSCRFSAGRTCLAARRFAYLLGAPSPGERARRFLEAAERLEQRRALEREASQRLLESQRNESETLRRLAEDRLRSAIAVADQVVLDVERKLENRCQVPLRLGGSCWNGRRNSRISCWPARTAASRPRGAVWQIMCDEGTLPMHTITYLAQGGRVRVRAGHRTTAIKEIDPPDPDVPHRTGWNL